MANKKENITITADSEIKAEAVELFNKLGMNMTTAINIFLHRCVREGKIPFEVSLTPEKEDTKK